MEGERILKSLLNGQTDGLSDDTKNYLVPLQNLFENKNGCKLGCKAADETVSKYSVFCTKFLRCAIETLKKVKSKGNDLDAVADSLNLVSTLLYNTLSSDNGKYLKYIPSLDQLGKTLYLIVVHLINKNQFDRGFFHASHLLKYLQLLKKFKSCATDKVANEFASLASRTSDTLLQGAARLEDAKTTAAERASHLCVVLEWRKLSLLFQAEAVCHSSVKSLVDRTLKCGTKYQLDCGQKSVSHKALASFFEAVFNTVTVKTHQLLDDNSDESDVLLPLVELGFHFGRISHKAGKPTEAVAVFDKLLEVSKDLNPSTNGHTKLPLQICSCVCLVCKVAILLTCEKDLFSQSSASVNQILFQSVDILRQVVKCKSMAPSVLKLLSDSLEYFRIVLQNVCNKHTDSQASTAHKRPCLTWRTFQGVEQALLMYVAVLDLQCEQLRVGLQPASNDAVLSQLRQQLDKATDRQITVLSFVISLYQDQMKSDENTKDSIGDSRLQIANGCLPVAQQASELIHAALTDLEMSMSVKELRYLGCNVYNLGCMLYQRDCFTQAVPLLGLACDELKAWCFAAESEDQVFARSEEMKLLTKYALLTDCQRRACQFTDAVSTATTQVLVALRKNFDSEVIRQQVKQWTAAKHELVKSLQDEEKPSERARTLCSTLAEQDDASDVVGGQLSLILEQELGCYREKSYDSAVEEIAVIRQLIELYSVQEDALRYGASILELAIALHGVQDNIDSGEDKSALQYCQEAAGILEQLSDESQNEEATSCHYLSTVQDRLAAAYLWQAVLEHEESMKETSTTEALSDSYSDREVEAISLEQPFILSLYSALDKWTVLAGRAMQQQSNGKVDLSHFYSAEETCYYLLIAARMYGLLNQPFNRVRALHLAAIIHQAIGTQDFFDRALSAYSEAVHSLCDMLDFSHACLLLGNASDLLDIFQPSAAVRVEFLLCRSHYLLVTGKYTEGEESLSEALKSDVLSQKSFKSHLLKARLKSLCMKYLLLPVNVHELKVTLDPLLGSLTALEAGMDGFRKLSHMGEEIFGEQVFGSGKKNNKATEDTSRETNSDKKGEAMLISSDTSQSAFQLSLLLDLLCSLLQVGQLYAHQGAVREAYRQFVDGLTLAKRFCLPHRVAEFLVNIAQLDIKQGKADKSQLSLDELKAVLRPLLGSSSKRKVSKEGIEVPTFLEHPKECVCTSCVDPVLHFIFIDYYLCLSNHLACTSRPEQSIYTLEIAESVCESAEHKMINSLEKLSAGFSLAEKADAEVIPKTTKRKGRACKSSKTRKTKEESSLKSCSLSQLMLSRHYATLYFLNTRLLLCSGKVEKAMEVLSGALEFLRFTEDVSHSVQVTSVSIKASLIHLSGLTNLLHAVDNGPGCKWFPRCKLKDFPNEKTAPSTVRIVSTAQDAEDVEEVKPRKGARSTRTRNLKSAEQAGVKGNGRKTTSKAKGRSKGQRVEDDSTDCEQHGKKADRNTKTGTRTTGTLEATDGNSTDNLLGKGSRYLHQAIQCFNEAFALCQVCPPPDLFASICQALALCHGRVSPKLAMCYMNLSLSVTLRHQAVSSSGKRIRRLLKEEPFSPSLDHNKDITHLADQLSCLSLRGSPSSDVSDDVHDKLLHLVKARDVMMFKSTSLKGKNSVFTAEEVKLLQNIPKEWTVCTLELFQLPGQRDKELMICRMRAGCEPVLVKINTVVGEESTSSSRVDDQVVMDLTKLFQCSVEEEFNDIMSDSVKSMSVDNTSEWWAQRTRLDNRMKNLLERLEACWLGRWKGVLLGQSVNKEYHESVASAAKQLQERIEQCLGNAPHLHLLEVLVDSSSHLSKMETEHAFLEICGLDDTSPHLREILVEFEEITSILFSFRNKKNKGKKTKPNTQSISRHPVILILGKGIQHLPWESIPLLYDQPVTRVPSLQFLLSKVSCESQLPEVDPMKTFYVLNPQNNLPNTQKMFQKWFKGEDGWHGIAGNAPTQEEFSSALTDHELFIYFGHGTGREFLLGDDIQRLDCRAVTLLMGCSSGKLMVGGECEPRGMVLNYLLAGCPAIVANLWDVTDKDIDRFSESLLKLWLKQDMHLSLPEALSQSRQACKLKYLIGASPVVYGLPAYTKG